MRLNHSQKKSINFKRILSHSWEKGGENPEDSKEGEYTVFNIKEQRKQSFQK
jgi:hypothetical protein